MSNDKMANSTVAPFWSSALTMVAHTDDDGCINSGGKFYAHTQSVCCRQMHMFRLAVQLLPNVYMCQTLDNYANPDYSDSRIRGYAVDDKHSRSMDKTLF